MKIESRIIGRDAELKRMDAALEMAGGLVLVSGEGGIGKSRLVREAAKSAAAAGRFVVWARPEQVARSGPFALILDLVENVAARADGAVSSEAEALAASLLEPHDLSSGPAARRVAARIRGLLSQAGDRPLAIFEDIHVADEASHAVILHLARSAYDDGRALIATYRSEELGLSDELDRFLDAVGKERLALDVRLDPLSREDSRMLAASMLADVAADGQIDWIAAQSDGIPFFVEELAAAYLQTRSMQAVPESVARAVQARASRLGPVARSVATAASLVGGLIDAKVLSVALDLDPSAVSRSLTEAARAGLVEDREGKLVFRHALIRDALAGAMVSVEAEETHRRLAVAIEQVHGDAGGRHAKALARHWYEGRDRERAFRYAMEAGERALALAATHEARLAFELAGACTPVASAEVLAGLAEVATREGRMNDAVELFGRAAASYDESGRVPEAARALARLAWVHAVERRFDEAFELLERALTMTSNDDESLRATLLAQMGRMFSGGRDEQRGRALADAVVISDRLADHATRADALDGLAWQAYREHREADAIRMGEAACEAAMLSGRPESIGRCHNNCALIHSGCGSPERGLELLRTARERLQASFGSFGVLFIDTSEALMRFRMGEPGAVAAIVARLDVGWRLSRGTVHMLHAWALVQSGETARATAILEAARHEVAGAPERFALSHEVMEIALGEFIVAVENDDTSAAAAVPGLMAYDWSRAVADDEALALTLAARALLCAGDDAGASAVVERLEGLLERFHARNWAASAMEIRGGLAERDEDLREAARCYESAVAELAAYPNAADRARCLRLLAALQGAGDGTNRESAIASLREARVLALDAGSSLEAARSEAALRGFGIRPRAGRPKKSATSIGLSPRETEVAALVAAGATNAEIAGRLFLSERTVQDHVTHALRKLSLSGRAGLAAWAAKRGLI